MILASGRPCVLLSLLYHTVGCGLWNISNLMTTWTALVLGWAEFGSFNTARYVTHGTLRKLAKTGNQWGAERSKMLSKSGLKKRVTSFFVSMLAVSSFFFILLYREGRVDSIATIQVGENPLLKGTREELKKKKHERMMEEITGSIVGGREQESWPS